MIKQLKTFLLGKTASYRLNAYDDAAIASEIICYVTTGEIPDGPHPIYRRAAQLIAQTPDEDKNQRLIVQAYTMFHLNGYADLMYSRFIEKLGGLEPPIRQGAYGESENSPIDLWFWIAPLLKKDTTLAESYAREVAGIELTLSYREVMREIVRVQEANIAANRHTCQLLKNNTETNHPKVNMLRKLADSAAHPRIFLVSAARTQIAAGNWDKLLVWFLVRLRGIDRQRSTVS